MEKDIVTMIGGFLVLTVLASMLGLSACTKKAATAPIEPPASITVPCCPPGDCQCCEACKCDKGCCHK